MCDVYGALMLRLPFGESFRKNVKDEMVLLREVAVCVEMLQTLQAGSQVSTSEVTNTTHLPHTDQLP